MPIASIYSLARRYAVQCREPPLDCYGVIVVLAIKKSQEERQQFHAPPRIAAVSIGYDTLCPFITPPGHS
jgi:hypothetical protein